MKDNLAIATDILLAPADLDHQHLSTLMSSLTASHIDYADLYFQNTFFETWSLEDSQIKGGSYNIDKGVGVRAVSGDKTGFAYSDDIVMKALLEACQAAKSISQQHQKMLVPSFKSQSHPVIYSAENPLNSLTQQDKIALLMSVDQHARQQDPRVKQVNASLSGCYEVVLILNNQGKMVADIRPLISLNVSVIVEDKKGRESARSGGGARANYQFLYEQDRAKRYAEEAVREALVNLDAVQAPAGTMPVVLGPGWPGVLLHEAVGHGLEGDFNRKKLSAFSGRMGEKVASQGVTVVDNGTLSDRRGSLCIDDEGTPSQCTTLIENGVLVNYMQDKLNARLMNMAPTGNCRRESYAHIPLPRMTNTYMLPGELDKDEIIASVDKGLYAVNFGGGQVDITSGKFVFSASEAYLIENGKVTAPVKGATLIGSGPEVMQQISMIGNDLSLDEGIGVCGKEGQSVPVGVGQPTLKIDALTVGGTDKG